MNAESRQESFARFRALLWTAVLVVVPALTTSADEWNTGVYVSLRGGAFLVGNAKDVAADLTADASLEERLPTLGKDWEFGVGGGGTAGVGNDFGAIRLDGEMTYLTSGVSISRNGKLDVKTNKDSFTVLAFTGNAWYDIGTGSGWTFYVGGGFGTANLGINLLNIKEATGAPDYTFAGWSLAFQAGAGIGYHVADVVVIDLGYRLLGAIDPTLVKSGVVEGESFTWPVKPGTLLTHRLSLGLRVLFL